MALVSFSPPFDTRTSTESIVLIILPHKSEREDRHWANERRVKRVQKQTEQKKNTRGKIHVLQKPLHVCMGGGGGIGGMRYV